MQRFFCLFLMLFSSTVYAQKEAKPEIRFPADAMKPSIGVVPKLTADIIYVVEADVTCIVTASPRELVKVTKIAGPLRVFGKFLDGSGKSELRECKGKWIFLVEAAGVGRTAVLAIPSTATEETDIMRKTVDVDNGEAPRPPPIPPDPKPPIPPKPDSILKHITFIGPELNATALAINNDAELRKWFKANGVAVHVLRANSPDIAAKNFTNAVKDAGGAPCVVLQDEGGNILDSGSMSSKDQVKILASIYIKR